MRRKKSTGTAVVPVGEPSRNVLYSMPGGGVLVDAVYHVPEIHPRHAGPWSGESDKVAWTDWASGYGCIIRRAARSGCLEGYVGVGPSHPLFGLEPGALVGMGLRAHGGVRHAAKCQTGVPESFSICHVRLRPITSEQEKEPVLVSHRHDDAWWLGFGCDQASDVIPNHSLQYADVHVLDGVNERVYRDEAFVYRECVHLAAQLRAIADGRDPADVAPLQSAVPIFDTRGTEG